MSDYVTYTRRRQAATSKGRKLADRLADYLRAQGHMVSVNYGDVNTYVAYGERSRWQIRARVAQRQGRHAEFGWLNAGQSVPVSRLSDILAEKGF